MSEGKLAKLHSLTSFASRISILNPFSSALIFDIVTFTYKHLQ
jgi:hypothetical protein